MILEHITKEQVMKDVEGLQYLFRLKREIRYAQTRNEEDSTESVAEHVYGMHIVAQFFLPLIDPENTLDRARIFEMITIHDIDEIETGDMLGYLKTEEMRKTEIHAGKRAVSMSPSSLQNHFNSLLEECDRRETAEAKFVKAIDKFEPLIHLLNDKGKAILHKNKTTIEHADSVRNKYIEPFPVMFTYLWHIRNRMIEEGHHPE